MGLEQKLNMILSQKLVMTPALQQAISLLQKNRLELADILKNEIIENPVLEIADGVDEQPGENMEQNEKLSAEDYGKEKAEDERDPFDEIDLDSYFSDSTGYYHGDFEQYEDAPSFENMLRSSTSLADHLLWQLGLNTSSETIKEIGEYIIGNLDESGYLISSEEEIMAMGNYSREEVEEAIKVIHQMDPSGVGARNLQECLLIQLDHLDYEDTVPWIIVEKYLDELESGKYDQIARKLSISVEEVLSGIEIIKGLDPKPGSEYNSEESTYIIPDVYVYFMDGEYRVMLNDDGIPKLKISPVYKELLDRGKDGKEKGETTDYLKDKLRSALWFIKSIDQRQGTIYKVAESIVKHQRDFLDNGIIYLKPMILSDVADDIEMHQSTVSRVVNNKYMHTPQGLFEMKYFFHSGLHGANGEDISSLKTKELIKNIIASEDKSKPINDSAIAEKLADQGIDIARRTVAKYRKELKIPSSSKRKVRFP